MVFGRAKPNEPIATAGEWEDWKRAQVTRLVFDIRQTVSSRSKGKALSAAVLADPGRSRNYAFQDWKLWLDGGAIDEALLINYTTDMSVFLRNARDAAASNRARKIQLGIGAWLMLDNAPLLSRQIRSAHELGFRGSTLFSFSNLKNRKGYGLLKAVLR